MLVKPHHVKRARPNARQPHYFNLLLVKSHPTRELGLMLVKSHHVKRARPNARQYHHVNLMLVKSHPTRELGLMLVNPIPVSNVIFVLFVLTFLL